MFNFIKGAIREMKHVVWPTGEETRKYFITVVVVLVMFGLYLFIVSTVFTKALFGLRNVIVGGKAQYTVENSGSGAIKFDNFTGAIDDKKGTKNKKEEVKKEEVKKIEVKTGTGVVEVKEVKKEEEK